MSSVTEVILTEPPLLTIDIVSLMDVDCNGASTGEVITVADGGTQPYESYTIDGVIINGSNGIFNNLF